MINQQTGNKWLVHEWGKLYQVVEAEPHTFKKPGITMTGQRIVAKEINKANAHLIAAAPAMYEAIKQLFIDAGPEFDKIFPETYKRMTEALAQAEGRE